MKLIVLSDLHLMIPDEAETDLGNHARLDAAIDRINGVYSDADLVVFAGDLADRGKNLAPYQDLKAALTRLDPPHALTIGNHDSRENFTAVFGTDHSDEGGWIQSAWDLGETRVKVLDSVSTQPASPPYKGAQSPLGELCQGRLTWLQARLDEARGRPVLVILHHPPLQLGISSDFIALQDPEALIDLLQSHGNVRQVISGHIHMTTTALHQGIPFTTIAGHHSTTAEDFGTKKNKRRREGPAQMAVVFSGPQLTTVHFDNYVDHNPEVIRR